MLNNTHVVLSTSEAFQWMHDVSHGALVQNMIAMTNGVHVIRECFQLTAPTVRVMCVPIDSLLMFVCDPCVGVSVPVLVQIHTWCGYLSITCGSLACLRSTST